MVAGTVVAGSSIRVRIEAVGAETALAGIQRLVEQAQSSRSRAQALADRFAGLLVSVAVGAGVVTFIVFDLAATAGVIDTVAALRSHRGAFWWEEPRGFRETFYGEAAPMPMSEEMMTTREHEQ